MMWMNNNNNPPPPRAAKKQKKTKQKPTHTTKHRKKYRRPIRIKEIEMVVPNLSSCTHTGTPPLVFQVPFTNLKILFKQFLNFHPP